MTTAYTVANAVPMTKLPTTNGVIQEFVANATNAATSTFAPDGLAAAPIFGQGGQPLEGGEIVSEGIVTLESYVGPLLNSDDLCWVLVSCVGGALQVAPALEPEQAPQLQQIGHGQCRLSVTNATTLTLSPYNGNNVIVNGVPLQLPSAGVKITNTGLSASTVYYAYLSGSTATPSLVLSTTGHVTGENGIEVMSGDATKTLVGLISTNASSQFADSVTQRFCLNWFNRRNLSLISEQVFAPTFSFSVATHLEPSTDVSWLSWGDEASLATVSGDVANSVAGATSQMQLYIDGSVGGVQSSFTSTTTSALGSFSSATYQQYSEGTHTAQVWGNATGGVTTYGFQMDVAIRG